MKKLKKIRSIYIILFLIIGMSNFSYAGKMKQLHLFIMGEQPINCFALSPDKKKIAVGSADGLIKIINIEKQKIQDIGKHLGEITGIAWSYDGVYLVSASKDSTVKKWDLITNTVQIMREHEGAIFCVAISPDNNWVASSGSDNKVVLWQPKTNEIKIMSNHGSSVWSIAFSPNGNFLTSGGGEGDNKVILWKYSTNQILEMNKHKSGINTVSFSPNGMLIASASLDGQLKIVNLKTQEVTALSKIQKPIWKTVFNPVKPYIIANSNDQNVYQWQLKTGQKSIIYSHKYTITDIMITRQYLIISDSKGQLLFLTEKK